MKAFVVLLVVALAGCVVAQPFRPKISETFEGEGYTHIVTPNETIWGLGRWVIDEPNGHGLEFWEFSGEHRHHSVHVLKRYDVGLEYAIHWLHHPTPHAVCHKRAVTPPMPPAWAWIEHARYHGKHAIDGTTFDLWAHHHGGVELEVAVGEHDANRPHYFMRRTPSEHRSYHLIGWATFKPNETWFHIPDVCKNATEELLGGDEDVDNSGAIAMDGDDTVVGTCGVAAETAQRIVTQSNGASASQLLSQSFNKAGINIPAQLTGIATGGRCDGGARVGDVFTDGTPITSAAIYLGGNDFAECKVSGGECSIVPQRDFTGGCRRFC